MGPLRKFRESWTYRSLVLAMSSLQGFSHPEYRAVSDLQTAAPFLLRDQISEAIETFEVASEDSRSDQHSVETMQHHRIQSEEDTGEIE